MYAQVNDATGELECQIGSFAPGGFGPYPAPPSVRENITYHIITEPILWGTPPSDTSVMLWNGGDYYWQETAALEDLRSRKNDEINTCRETSNTDSFMFQGKAIRCKPLDRSDIDGTNGYVALFGEFPDGWQGGWKAIDNTYVAISTVDEWKAFYKAMVDTGNANFRYAQQLKFRLASAETPEQIAAIKWETPNG